MSEFSPIPAPSRSRRRVVLFSVGGAAAVAVALGGGAVALASGPGSGPSASGPSGSASVPAPTSSGTAGSHRPEPRRHAPHLDGTVVSANRSSIVITDHEGFRRTIDLSSKTSYTDGLSATPAAGTRIHAEGTVASDKTSLDATRVGKAPAGPKEGGPGGKGDPRHGPGRGHRPPAPPSGGSAPSGRPSPPSGRPSAPSSSGGQTPAPSATPSTTHS